MSVLRSSSGQSRGLPRKQRGRLHSAPPALEPLTGTIPDAVKEIIQKSLEKKPENRYQTPEELLSALARARASLRPAAKPGVAAPPRVPASWRHNVRTAALFLVMLVGAACALFAVLYRPGPSAPPPDPSVPAVCPLGA